MFLVYNLILTLLSPIWVPWMIWRSRKRKEAPNWQERQGNFQQIPKKQKNEKRVWIHAVSLGEMIATKPLLISLREKAPHLKIILSTTTSSGHEQARNHLKGLYDHLVYFPIDLPRFQLRAIQIVRPDATIIMETELWFNFLWAAKVFDAKTLIVNGRHSDRAFKNSKKVRWFYHSLFKNLDQCLVQSELDAERFAALGAKNVQVFGNMKFDEAAGSSKTQKDWKHELQILHDEKVIVIGSTRSELEEEMVQKALIPLVSKHENLRVIHAPRHLETSDRIQASWNQKADPNLAAGKRSLGDSSRYLLLDTFGELGSVYEIADLVIIGGGFDRLGGQNLIQPLALGKPVLHGPHMFNFREVAEQSTKVGASRVCSDAVELQTEIETILFNEEVRKEMSTKAKALIKKNLGATDRYTEAILSSIS